MHENDYEAARKKLQTRAAALQSIRDSASDGRKPVELDQTSVGRLSRIDSIQMQQMALATERRREEEMQRIKAALKRIEQDTYGYCIVCDEEIAKGRLDADPAVPTCVRCAGAAEK